MEDIAKKSYSEKRSISADEVNLLPLVLNLLKRLWLIALVSVLVGAGFFGATKALITPTYRAYFTAYINNKSQVNNTQDTISYNDIIAAEQLVQAYSKTIKSHSVLSAAAASVHSDESYEELERRVSTEVENETFIITVYVVDSTPESACRLAKAIADAATNKIADIFEGSSMRVIDAPQVPTNIYKPSYIKNTAIGCLLGGLLTAAYIIIRFLTDDKVKNDADLESHFSIPVVGVIPDMTFNAKGDRNYYDYEYAYRRSELKRTGENNGEE